VLVFVQIARVSLAPGAAVTQYRVPAPSGIGEAVITVSAVQQNPNDGKLFSVHDAITPPGTPELSESSVSSTTEFVPELQEIATSMLVRDASKTGVKAIAIELNAPGKRSLLVPYIPQPPWLSDVSRIEVAVDLGTVCEARIQERTNDTVAAS
jgi:hypothetical protein